MLCYVESSRVELFWLCYGKLFWWLKAWFSSKDLIGWMTFRRYLLVASQILTHLYHVLIISLGSFRYCKLCFKLKVLALNRRDKV